MRGNPAGPLTCEVSEEAGADVAPVALHRAGGDAQELGRFVLGQAREETQLDQAGGFRIVGGEAHQGFLEGQEFQRGRFARDAELRGDLDWIVLRALRKDPERRYASAAALAEDVLRHLAHEPVSAGPPTALYRLGKFARRNRPGVAAGLTTAAALVVALWISRSEKLRADVLAAEASRERNHVLSLSAFQRLEDLRREAEDLWPAIAATVPAAEAWLERAHELVAGLGSSSPASGEGHHAMLATLRERAIESGEDGEGSGWWTFATDEDRWWHTQLAELVREIEAFADPETGLMAGTGPPHGWGIARRLEEASSLESSSVSGESARARWAEAIRSIADVSRCPDYRGLALTPQLGLLPLARNPSSGLWEFLHLQSGAVPERSPEGAYLPSAESGIVLALIPGGTAALGAQSADASEPNFDPLAQLEDGPVHEIVLDPFFLGIHELTQGQWLRFAGENPSNYLSGVEYAEQLATDWNPVEQVSWNESMRFLERLGLTLPTEAQWEDATRAGSTDPWWVGAHQEDLDGAANLRDDTVRIHAVSWHPIDTWMNDGHVVHSPVGSFAPNRYGLHDVHGNVWEWCRDHFLKYELGEFAPGDGLHVGPRTTVRAYRGGSFFQQARDSRSAGREGFPPESQHDNVGLRAARALLSAAPDSVFQTSEPGNQR